LEECCGSTKVEKHWFTAQPTQRGRWEQ